MRVDEKRSREIMENAENLERSYNGLIRQYDELTRKFEQLSVGAAGEKRSKSPPPVIPTPIPK
jgi:hypothetical protein